MLKSQQALWLRGLAVRFHLWLLLALIGLFHVTSSHAAITVVSYWRLGENDPGAAVGGTVTNTTASVGAKNLKFNGNASYTNDVAPTAATHTGSSLSVKFANSAYATNTIVSTATNNFGIECWVKPTALGGNQVIAYNGVTGGAGSGGWGIFLSSNTNYYGLFGGVAFVGGAPATANVWTHLALVRNNGTAILYVNGVAAGALVANDPGLPAGNFALATDPQSPGGELFNGLIDEVRVFTFSPGQFRTNDLLLKATVPFLTVNGNNPLFLKHQTWIDSFGATVHEFPSKIAGGGYNSLALKADGTVVAWGYNNKGELNIPASATNVVAIAAGDYHDLALKEDGTVVGWGFNNYGQINIPGNATNVVAIAAGYAHSLALKADGTVVGWGADYSGQIDVPASATNVVAIAAGDDDNLALKADGTVVAWGDNSFGQLNIPSTAINVVAIAAGGLNGLALRSDGIVIAWGDNSYGQNGIYGADHVVAIAANVTYNLALKADGTVVGWGDNSHGQLNFPASATHVIAIAAGYAHGLALKADGTVIGWGDNSYGQINIPPGLDVVNLPVVETDNVNTNVPGSYQANYFSTNPYGIGATASRNVLVIDSPIISNPSASLVATNAADGHRIARFSASINPNGSPTIVSIDYGLTAGYGVISSTNILPALFTPQTTAIDVPLSPGFTYHWNVAATNGMDSIPGSAFSSDQIITVPAAFLPGDINGDGIVDQSELDAVYSNYLPNSPWLLMTNVAGLGQTNVSFGLSNSPIGGYSVEVSTNLIDWQFLGPATPRYLFTDTNAPTGPQRYYRLRYP